MTLRGLSAKDRAGLFEAAKDPITWAGHPNHDRWKPAVFDPYFDGRLNSTETLAVLLDDYIIGCSRYYTPSEDPTSVAIGFTFVHHAHWGGAINRRMKSLMLAHAFAHHDPIWFHIAPSNIRSQKATAKLGARLVAHGQTDVVGTTGDWLTYTLSHADWQAAQQSA